MPPKEAAAVQERNTQQHQARREAMPPEEAAAERERNAQQHAARRAAMRSDLFELFSKGPACVCVSCQRMFYR